MSSHPATDSTASLDRLPYAPSLERRRLRFYLLLVLADGIAIAAGFSLAARLYLGNAFDPSIWGPMQVLLPLYWTLALANQAYSINALVDPSYALQRMGTALAGAVLLQTVLLFLTRSGLTVSRFGFSIGLGLALFMIVWLRANLQPYVRRALGERAINLLLIDDGGPPLAIEDSYRINAAGAGIRPDLADPHALDRLAQAMRNMDRVVVSCPPERRPLWAMVLKGGHMQGEIVDSEVDRLGILGTGREAGMGTLIVAAAPLGLRARVLKRMLDLAITVPALLALSLPLLFVAALIHLEDGGAVLFRQRRVGRNNRFFWIYKFRTMRESVSDAAGAQSASRDDDRITRIGRWLRRTSIDELPQLLNVIRGEMSLVGPRPHALGSQAGDKLFWEVDERYWHRHALKPGLSGLAQIRGFRGATDTESDLLDRLQADLEYVAGWTIGRDIRILLGTLQVIVHDRAF